MELLAERRVALMAADRAADRAAKLQSVAVAAPDQSVGVAAPEN